MAILSNMASLEPENNLSMESWSHLPATQDHRKKAQLSPHEGAAVLAYRAAHGQPVPYTGANEQQLARSESFQRHLMAQRQALDTSDVQAELFHQRQQPAALEDREGAQVKSQQSRLRSSKSQENPIKKVPKPQMKAEKMMRSSVRTTKDLQFGKERSEENDKKAARGAPPAELPAPKEAANGSDLENLSVIENADDLYLSDFPDVKKTIMNSPDVVHSGSENQGHVQTVPKQPFRRPAAERRERSHRRRLLKMNMPRKNCGNVKNNIIFNNMFFNISQFDNNSDGGRGGQSQVSVKKSLSRPRNRIMYDSNEESNTRSPNLSSLERSSQYRNQNPAVGMKNSAPPGYLSPSAQGERQHPDVRIREMNLMTKIPVLNLKSKKTKGGLTNKLDLVAEKEELDYSPLISNSQKEFQMQLESQQKALSRMKKKTIEKHPR